MRAATRRLALVTFLVTLASCGQIDAVEDPDWSAPATADVETWRLSDTPEFRLPVVGVGEDSIYFGVLGPLGIFTENGDILIAIREDYRVVYLDSLGSGITTYGGFGQGPGEFRRITVLTLNGDKAAAWDWINNRASLYANGEPAGQISLRVPRTQTFVGLLDDGSVVTTPRDYPYAELLAPEDVIAEGEERPYHLLDRSGERIGTLFGPPEPGPPTLSMTAVGATRSTGRMNFSGGCWPQTMHMTRGVRLLIADSREGRLYSMDRAGVLTSFYASAHRDIVREEYVDLIADQIERWDERLGPLTAESTEAVRNRAGTAGDPFPAVWSGMASDLQGDVWLQRASCYASWFSEPTTTWEVIGPEGRLRATVTVPSNVTILSVDGDRVLASETDELEVQHLALYRIVR